MYGSILSSVTCRPRASSSAPSEADARPLPSDETTPPVTKMNLVLLPCTDVLRLSTSAAAALSVREFPGTLQVLGSIYLKRWGHGRHHPDSEAAFERAELFELLDLLQTSGRQ